jgi:hypothetical protein
MKKLVAAFAFCFICSCPAKGPTAPGPTSPAGVIVDCAVDAVRGLAVKILAEVATALSSGNWEAVLLDLVTKVGGDAVDCAVKQITFEALHAAQVAPGDAIATTKANHGRAWLTKRAPLFK